MGGDHAQAPCGGAPRQPKKRTAATALACTAGAVALVCAGLALGTLYGPGLVRAWLPSVADELGILVEPEPQVERLEDGFDGELARRVAAVSAELQRSAYHAPDLAEATAGALGGLLAAADPDAEYLAPGGGRQAGDTVEARMEGSCGVVAVARFAEGTADDVAAAVGDLLDRGARALVLDLRANPGGSLNEAVATASLFVRGGTAVERLDADGSAQRVAVEGSRWMTDAPLAVLVSGETAGVAEALAACLQDHGRALLVGQTTAGRAGVQTVMTLSFGGAVAFSTASFRTPDGNEVQGVGVRPDVAVSPAASVAGGTAGEGASAQPADTRVAGVADPVLARACALLAAGTAVDGPSAADAAETGAAAGTGAPSSIDPDLASAHASETAGSSAGPAVPTADAADAPTDPDAATGAQAPSVPEDAAPDAAVSQQ